MASKARAGVQLLAALSSSSRSSSPRVHPMALLRNPSAALSHFSALQSPAPRMATGLVPRLQHGALHGPVIRVPFSATGGSVAVPSQVSASRMIQSSRVAAAKERADAELVKALQAEIAHEENAYDPDETLAGGPPSPFKVESNAGASELVLRRSFNKEDIAVIASQPEDMEDDLGYDGEVDGEEEQQEEVEAVPAVVPVRVSITKKAADGSTQTLEIDTAIQDEDGRDIWVIEGVSLPSPHVPDTSIAYTGPDFYSLDPAVCEQFDEYLIRRGFNAELAGFVRSALENKEQQEYVSWLARVKGFVSA